MLSYINSKMDAIGAIYLKIFPLILPYSGGFCFYKATNGIKRHLAVDSFGLPFFTHCTKANISDDQGLIEMLTINIDYFKDKPVELPKITILLDNGYHPRKIQEESRSSH